MTPKGGILVLTTVEKIRVITDRRGLTNTQLAEATDMTRQNLSNKLSRGDLRESDMRKLAEALGCTVNITFVLNDTGESI